MTDRANMERTIGGNPRAAGVNVKTVRYYERIGLLSRQGYWHTRKYPLTFEGVNMRKGTDTREAFRRNRNRANRWNETFDLAVEKVFLMPIAPLGANGLVRTTMMGL